jgi:Lon protease-like protein
MIKIENLPKKISVFPLPNFIIFPNTSVPLNIFEPRYLKMIDDSMKSSRIIGMIQPKKKNNAPELYSVGCAGKITSFNETEDGRYLIVLNGVSRFQILKEINNNKPYRECEVTFDKYSKDTIKKKNNIKLNDLELIFNHLKSIFKKRGYTINWKELEKQSLDQTINTLAMASPITLEEKQVLLETESIENRKIKLEKILNTYVVDNFSNTTIQ